MTTWQNRIVSYKQVPANELLANPMNARRHPAKQREALRGSLDTLGIIAPVIVNARTGYLIDGHARIEEALSKDENLLIPVVEVDLSPEEELTALASYDFITYLAEYDKQILGDLLEQVEASDTRVQALLDELAEQHGILPELVASEGAEARVEIADELQAQWQVQRGELFRIGKHRLLCGDSANPEDVAKLMDGAKAQTVYTDPPYGMNLDTDFSGMNSKLFKGKTGGNYHEKIIGDDKPFDPTLFPALFLADEVFLWGADYYAERIPNKNKGSWFVWDKRLTEEADKMWGSGFELCWSKNSHKRDLVRIKWAGIFGMETQDTRARVHANQKPIELAHWFLSRYAKGIVCDFFGGSGSTMIACEKLNLPCYMIEMHPKYCAVILQRMSDMGLEVIREGTTWDAERN